MKRSLSVAMTLAVIRGSACAPQSGPCGKAKSPTTARSPLRGNTVSPRQ